LVRVALTISTLDWATQYPMGKPRITPSSPSKLTSPRMRPNTWARVAPTERSRPNSRRLLSKEA